MTVTMGTEAMNLRGCSRLGSGVMGAVWHVAIVVLFSVMAAKSAAAGTPTVLWDPHPAPDVTGYIVSWGTTSGVYTNSFDVGNTTSYAFTPPNTSLTYYIVVQAYNSA